MYYKSMIQIPTIGYDGLEVKTRVVGKLWTWLDENFHKLSEPNKLKIISVICPKTLPQIIEATNTNINKMESVKIEENPLEFTIGNNRITEAAQHSN